MPIFVEKTDITKKNVEVIVNASNGIGIMGGGVAGAIARAAGKEFLKEVRTIAMNKSGGHDVGECYVTPSGDLSGNGVKAVFHAVTMKFPGGPTNYGIVISCLEKVFILMRFYGYKSVAIPALGGGIGGLDRAMVALEVIRIANKYKSEFDIFVVGIDDDFIDAATKEVERMSIQKE